MKEYLDALNVPELTDEEVQAIDQAGSEFHYRRFVSFAVAWSSDRSPSVTSKSEHHRRCTTWMAS
jgi:hypothetical protein